MTIVFLFFITKNGQVVIDEALPYDIVKVIPYVLVLAGALIGLNVFVVLVGGIVVSLVIGIATGSLMWNEMFQVVGNGVMSMYDITVIEELVTDNEIPKSFEPYLDCEIENIYPDCDYDDNGELMSFLSIYLR